MSVPYACPVCHGRGIVPPHFYNLSGVASTACSNEECRSCKGTGIIFCTLEDDTN